MLWSCFPSLTNTNANANANANTNMKTNTNTYNENDYYSGEADALKLFPLNGKYKYKCKYKYEFKYKYIQWEWLLWRRGRCFEAVSPHWIWHEKINRASLSPLASWSKYKYKFNYRYKYKLKYKYKYKVPPHWIWQEKTKQTWKCKEYNSWIREAESNVKMRIYKQLQSVVACTLQLKPPSPLG